MKVGAGVGHIGSGADEVDLWVEILEASEAPDRVEIGSEQVTRLQVHAVTEADCEMRKIGYYFGRALDHLWLHEENVHRGAFVAGHLPKGTYPGVIESLALRGRIAAQRPDAVIANVFPEEERTVRIVVIEIPHTGSPTFVRLSAIYHITVLP